MTGGEQLADAARQINWSRWPRIELPHPPAAIYWIAVAPQLLGELRKTPIVGILYTGQLAEVAERGFICVQIIDLGAREHIDPATICELDLTVQQDTGGRQTVTVTGRRILGRLG